MQQEDEDLSYSSFRCKICKNGLQKWNLCEKLGKEHLDCKKSTLAKSQQSNLVKVNHQKRNVNGWHQQVDWQWRQQMMWRWRKQVMSARADVAVMTSVGKPTACEARGSTLSKLWAMHEGAWTIRWSLFFSKDANWRKMILMVSAATWSEKPWWRMEVFAKTLTGAWRRVDGQIWMLLVAMCRAIEKLHSDMSYVLIGGQRWQIRWWQWFWRRMRSF